MKKNDFILIAIILIIAVSALLYINTTKQGGDKVVVEVDGEIYKELPLDVDATIEIEGVAGSSNLLVIKDGYADVADADCPDKLCVEQKSIQNNGETIVCLPNKVIVEVKSSNDSEVDAIAN